MKGILQHTDKGWFIYHEDSETGTYVIDVRPGRIEELNSVGTYLKVNSEVDFVMEEVSYFPYRYAVPIINMNTKFDESQQTSSIQVPPKKTKKQYKITLWLSGFAYDEVEVICDAYEASSNGYFYFYNQDNQTSRRIMLCYYPIERTAIHKFEQIETEY